VTTCDDVRPLLPDHLLGSLTEEGDVEVRGHLRGCAGCRRELAQLDEGLGVFGSTLAREAPAELRGRVQEVLAEEWAGHGTPRRRRSHRPPWAISIAAAIAIAASAAFGVVELGRARTAQTNADRYESVLNVLGGEGFRSGELRALGDVPADGSVLAYRSSHDQSFVLVFVRAPGLDGLGTMVVTRLDGTTWVPGKIEFDGSGDAAAWWVTANDVGSIDRLTVRAPDGSALASARIRDV
jgi:hypothetical protein